MFLKKLLSVCCSDTSLCKASKLPSCFHNYPLVNDLINLLNKRNGFYGFESALHVFPFEAVGDEVGLIDWYDVLTGYPLAGKKHIIYTMDLKR